MRRLNESTDEYLHSLQQLKTECLKSNFNLALVNKILKIATVLLGKIVLVLTVLPVVNKLKLKHLFGLPLSQSSFLLTKQKKN